MKNDEKHSEEEKMCQRCGCKLYSQDSIEAGYCVACANYDKYARKAWKNKGLAKFCSCGQMLHAQDSIEMGKCHLCQITDKIRSGKWKKVLNILRFGQLTMPV